MVRHVRHGSCLGQERFPAAGVRSQQSTAQQQQASAGTLPRCQAQAALHQMWQLGSGPLPCLSPGVCKHHMVQQRVMCLCMHMLWWHTWHSEQRLHSQRLDQRMQPQHLEQHMQPQSRELRSQPQATP